MKRTVSVNRRTALKYAGATLVGALTTVAGCMGGGGSDGGNGESDTTSQTEQPTEAGSTTATGVRDIDLLPLEMYTNDLYSYSIKYPAKWRIDKSDPMHVIFTSPAAPGSLEVTVREDIPRSYTLQQATSDFLDRLGPTHEYNPKVKILTRRKVTLPNNCPAILLHFQISGYRENVVITVVNNTVYSARIALGKQAYTPTIVRQITDILTSLTIRGGTTSG